MLFSRTTLKALPVDPVDLNFLWIDGQPHEINKLESSLYDYVAVYVSVNGIPNGQCHKLPREFVLSGNKKLTAKTNGHVYKIT